MGKKIGKQKEYVCGHFGRDCYRPGSAHLWSAVRMASAAILLLIAGAQGAMADEKIPLASADRAQLDKYLGVGVVGDPVAAGALLPADRYLPKTGAAMTYRVLEQGQRPRSETHTVEDATDPIFAPGWRYARDPMLAPGSAETSPQYSSTSRNEQLARLIA